MARAPLVLAVAMLVAGCKSTARRQCVLFQEVTKTTPEGGVPIAIDVPSEWTETVYQDGSCNFGPRRGPGFVRVSLQLCLPFPGAPCDKELAGRTSLRTTSDMSILGQTMRHSVLQLSDPRSHHVVQCAGVVQGAEITKDLVETLQRLDRICDTIAVTPDMSRRSP